MAYVTIKDFNEQLTKIGNSTLFTQVDTSLNAKNLERISGDLEKFNFVDLMTALSYKAPSVALTTSLTGLVYELGTTVSGGQTLTAVVTKGSSPIVSVEFFRNGTSVNIVTENVMDGGSFTYASGTDITMSETYKAVVTCEDGSTVEDTLSIQFYNPFYHGVTTTALDAITQADILGMTKDISAKGTKTYGFTSNNEYCVMAYPKEYGPLTGVLDSNGFQNIDSMNYREVEVNGVPYYVYQTNSLVICVDFTYKFLF